MTHTVWKAILQPLQMQDIEMPMGAKVLHAAEQYGQLCIWYHCDPNAPRALRRFAIVGTGHPAPPLYGDIGPEECRHVGTVIMSGGALVWHIFERSN